jgi:hypothetical protein
MWHPRLVISDPESCVTISQNKKIYHIAATDQNFTLCGTLVFQGGSDGGFYYHVAPESNQRLCRRCEGFKITSSQKTKKEPPKSIAECQQRRRDYIANKQSQLPDYAYGYEEGERYAKLRFTDPIDREADKLYAQCLEEFAEWQTERLEKNQENWKKD